MRLFFPVLFSVVALAAVNPHLAQVRSVYILPMAGGMDQFLANRITRAGGMLVVTDPQAADAIVTDRLGEGFERKLDELYPPQKDEDEEADSEAKKADADQNQQLRSTSFGHGKGTVFIVDRKTRGVLWSIYEQPKSSRADELNKTAEKIVHRLQHDLKPPGAAGSN